MILKRKQVLNTAFFEIYAQFFVEKLGIKRKMVGTSAPQMKVLEINSRTPPSSFHTLKLISAPPLRISKAQINKRTPQIREIFEN